MATSFPPGPFCIPDITPVCDRVAMMKAMAAQGINSPSVQATAKFVAGRVAQMASYGNLQFLLAQEALRVVQGLPYVPEKSGQDCYQTVEYTATYGGECKALTIYYVAVCRALGVDAEPVWITQSGQLINHVAAQVNIVGRAPMWADPSMRGARLGESPYEAIARLGIRRNDVIAAGGALAPSGCACSGASPMPEDGSDPLAQLKSAGQPKPVMVIPSNLGLAQAVQNKPTVDIDGTPVITATPETPFVPPLLTVPINAPAPVPYAPPASISPWWIALGVVVVGGIVYRVSRR